MRIGVLCLLLGYVFSQFYRAFLAVLAPFLSADLGMTADALARASGLWFLAFALTQLPLGWALDRVGPRRSTAALTLLAAAAAVLFALAPAPWAIVVAMVLLGIGCAPPLMAAYFLFARVYPPAAFATLGGAMLGLGSLGNLAAAWPMAWAAETLGWRAAVLGLAAITLAAAAAIWRWVEDPPPAPAPEAAGRLTDLIRSPAMWLIFPLLAVNYAPAAGLRGLWIGPYLQELHGAGASLIGQATLVMGLAMVAGSLAYGPLDRRLGRRKALVLAGNLAGVACLAALWALPAAGVWSGVLLLSAVGFFGATFPLLVAHGRNFIPPHLTGRGVTLMNLFAIGGVGVLQLASARVHSAAVATGAAPEAVYATLFGFFGLALLVGCVVYLFSRERPD